MENRALTIHVTPEAARDYEAASPEQQRKLDAMLSQKLREAMRDLRLNKRDRRTIQAPQKQLKAKDLLDSGLVGMWKDRPEVDRSDSDCP